MGTLDRYLSKKLLRTFLPTVGGLCFLFFLGASWRLLREQDLSIQQVAGSLPWVVPFLLPYLVPLAWLTTLALVYGRLVADQEVLAFVALGVPQRALARPALVLGGVLSLLMVWLTATVVPYCYQKRKEAAQEVFAQLFTLGEGQHLSRVFERQGLDLYVRRFGPEGLEGIVLHLDLSERSDDPTARSPVQVVARRGRIEATPEGDLQLELADVTATAETDRQRAFALAKQIGPLDLTTLPTPPPPVRLHLERYVQGVGLGGRRRLKAPDYGSADLQRLLEDETRRLRVSGLLGGFLATPHGHGEVSQEARLELGMRSATAATPLALTVLIVPLVLLLQARNALVPFAASVLVGSLVGFVPLLVGQSLGEASGQPLLVGVGPLIPLLVGAGLALVVARR